jgi:hypothetical protein
MTSARVIAEIRAYPEFTAALRAWIAELGTTYESVNELAGLQDGYLAKLIASTPIRSFSRVSLGNTLGALGVKLLLVVDDERLAAMRPRYTVSKRHASSGMPAVKPPAKSRVHTPLAGNPALAAFYAYRRAAILPQWRRKAIARKAARIRWRNPQNP